MDPNIIINDIFTDKELSLYHQLCKQVYDAELIEILSNLVVTAYHRGQANQKKFDEQIYKRVTQ